MFSKMRGLLSITPQPNMSQLSLSGDALFQGLERFQETRNLGGFPSANRIPI